MLLHIHGFNSSAASNTFRLLQAAFPAAHALEYPCHGLFADNLAALYAQAESLYAHAKALRGSTVTQLVISGSSLGGFYASQLSALLHPEAARHGGACHCALFNPVVRPAEALRPLLGINTHFYTGEKWEFTQDMLQSYAHFPDTRQLVGAKAGKPLQRFVLLGRKDALLNPEEARVYWQHCARIHYTDDEHSIAALDAVTVSALGDMGAGAL